MSVVPAERLLAVTPATAYFWGHAAGNGTLRDDCVVLTVTDDHAAETLATVAGTSVDDRRTRERESAHDASVVRIEDEYELYVREVGQAGTALEAPFEAKLDAFADRPELLRGLLEACGTVCFRESTGEVGISFVHDDASLLHTVRQLLADAEPFLPTEKLSESSSGGYWFGLADDADTAAFARWVYADSDRTGLYAADRRQKLRRSVERATDAPVGELS